MTWCDSTYEGSALRLSVVRRILDPKDSPCLRNPYVADNRGDSLHTYSSISNSVDELNAIYSQVAMEFGIGSISRTNSTILAGSRYGYAVFSQIIISAHPIDGRAGEW